MKIAIISINNPSLASATKLLNILKDDDCTIYNKSQEGKQFVKFDKLDDILPIAWVEYEAIICIMATGAVVRKIAPYLQNKATDPAVLVMTLDLQRVIPLVSGHLGGANELSQNIATSIKGCINFITTASDQIKLFSFDIFAKTIGYSISNLKSLAEVSNNIINQKIIQVVCYPSTIKKIQKFDGYKDKSMLFFTPDDLELLDTTIPTVYITPQRLATNSLQLHPREITLGLGMNRNTSAKEIDLAIKRFCYEHSLEFKDIKTLASFEAKSDEIGLLEYAKLVSKELLFFNKEEINQLEMEFSPSKATKFFNIKGVAEPASLLASKEKTLFLSKRIYGGVTIASSF